MVLALTNHVVSNRMIGAREGDGDDLLEGGKDAKRLRTLDQFYHHDELCKKFHLSLLRGHKRAGEGLLDGAKRDGGEKFWNPPFIHQFYPDCEAALKTFNKIESIELRISTNSFRILASVQGKAEEELGESCEALLQPIIAKFPPETFWFDKSQFECAEEADKECMLLGRGTRLSGSALLSTVGNVSDTMLGSLNARLQPLLLFFIDGASVIDNRDHKWILYFLHDQEGSVIGFCSAYPFLCFPDKTRLRISQFLVLPPFQRRGLGSLLYRSIMLAALGDDVEEITVEDPTDAFSDFRLSNDLQMIQEGLDVKLTALQREEVRLLLVFKDQFTGHPHRSGEEQADFVEWRKMVKKLLCKRYPDVAVAPKEEKIKALERLFNGELSRYQRILEI